MNVLEITDKNINDFIKNEGLSVVDCYAPWCGPCRMLSPIIDELSDEMGMVNFGKLNTDDYQDVAYEYRIMSIPTLLLFKNGELVDKLVGFKSKEELKDIFLEKSN